MRTAIAVAGLIRLAMTGELLRIDLFDPEGRQRVAQATTDDKGRFYAMFNLTTKPSLEARPDRGARERPLPGVYKVQAVIINSPNAAQAESNIVYVSR